MVIVPNPVQFIVTLTKTISFYYCHNHKILEDKNGLILIKNIKLLMLPQNKTSKIQYMDVGRRDAAFFRSGVRS